MRPLACCIAACALLIAACGSASTEPAADGIEATDATATAGADGTEGSSPGGESPGAIIDAWPGSTATIESSIESTIAVDAAGFAHIRNDLNARGVGEGRSNTELGDIDWTSEFVLMTVFDACDPVRTFLSIADGGASPEGPALTVNWEQGEFDCESLSPHRALFVVSRSIDVDGSEVALDPLAPFEVIGARSVDVLMPVRTEGAIKPAGIVTPSSETESGAFFFERADDAMAFLTQAGVEGEDEDGSPLPGVQSQTGVMTEDEWVLVVIQEACSPTDYEAMQTDAGFVHTKWEAPVDCAWAPPEAIVYVVPKVGLTGDEFSPDDPPAVNVQVIEEES